ncbi:MAG: hypothetical protein J6V22_00555, partial [Clostridia bacterium]|nr:hypothetical protein [Clostridia bacterium]
VVVPQTAQQVQFTTEMRALDDAMVTATTPAQRQAVVRAKAKAVAKAKKQGLTKSGDIADAMVEIANFNAALTAATTMQEQQSIIQAEVESMATPTAPVYSLDQAQFDKEMDALNSALAKAKSTEQQFAILDNAKQSIVKEREFKGTSQDLRSCNR